MRGIVASDYQRLTGAPVMLLAGEKDPYDDPAAHKGRGGRVSRLANTQITAQSREDAPAFLKAKLASPR